MNAVRTAAASTDPLRFGVAVAGLALLLRLSFVAWAPDRIAGDAFWYDVYARLILNGTGYVEIDGSPAIQWMPGWPFFLAGVYKIFSPSIRAGMVINAVLGSVTAAMLVPLGTRLFRAEVGRAAGVLYACWPGIIYFAATLMSESLFSFLFVASLLLFVTGTGRPRRTAWCAAGGLAFGLASLVKAESLGVAPALLAFLWFARPSLRDFVPAVAATALAGAMALAPWVVRNDRHFDQFLPTSASGGVNVYIGNHDGATGGEMFTAALQYTKRHQGANRAETVLAMNRVGWGDAWEFVVNDPGQELRILGRKLVHTYTRDDGGVLMLRGPGRAKPERFLGASESLWLTRIANGFWYFAMLAAAVGFSTIRSWANATRVLAVGTFCSFVAIHLVFLGGPRFHVSEVPILALVAGAGIEATRKRFRATQ